MRERVDAHGPAHPPPQPQTPEWSPVEVFAGDVVKQGVHARVEADHGHSHPPGVVNGVGKAAVVDGPQPPQQVQ